MLDVGLAAFEYRSPLTEALARVRAHGITRAEIGVGINLAPDGDLDAARAIVDQSGITITAVASVSKLNAAADVAAEQQLLRTTIRAAAALDADYAITYVGGNPSLSHRQAIQTYAARVQPLLKEAERLGIIIALENHFGSEPGDPTETAEGTLALLEEINHSHLRLNYDPCNYMVAGEEGYPYAYHLLKSYIVNVHIKDGMRFRCPPYGSYSGRIMKDHNKGSVCFAPLGEGALNSEGVLRKLIADGYDGPITIEAHTYADPDPTFQASLHFGRERGLWD